MDAINTAACFLSFAFGGILTFAFFGGWLYTKIMGIHQKIEDEINRKANTPHVCGSEPTCSLCVMHSKAQLIDEQSS